MRFYKYDFKDIKVRGAAVDPPLIYSKVTNSDEKVG